jgi:hypothetical protein
MTNCLFFALTLYWRRRGRAGQRYLLARRSRLGWTPHFLYAEVRRGRIRIISYKPNNTAFKACPPPVFAGRAAWGDSPERKDQHAEQ